MNDLPELPQNAISTLTILGLASDKQHAPVPLSLCPGRPIRKKLIDPRREMFVRTDSIPQRPPSTLPPCANLHLSLTLNDQIAYGRVGFVYGCTVNSISPCSSASAGYYIPPLVVKVANLRMAKDIAREAWFYKELEAVQGVLVPRCYGFFVAEVPEDLNIPIWQEDEQDIDDLDTEKDDIPRRVSILVLERLGERLPLGKAVCPEGATDEIRQMYNELGERGVLHTDIRWQNILCAPPSPPGLPGRPSTYANRVYRWRLIDFDRAERTVGNMTFVYEDYKDRLRLLFRAMENGYPDDGPTLPEDQEDEEEEAGM